MKTRLPGGVANGVKRRIVVKTSRHSFAKNRLFTQEVFHFCHSGVARKAPAKQGDVLSVYGVESCYRLLHGQCDQAYYAWLVTAHPLPSPLVSCVSHFNRDDLTASSLTENCSRYVAAPQLHDNSPAFTTSNECVVLCKGLDSLQCKAISGTTSLPVAVDLSA